MAQEEFFDDSLFAVAASFLVFLFMLYVWGIVRAYRAAGDGWKTMDRDVRLVFLFAVPLFRSGVQVLLWIDRFYTPETDIKARRRGDTSRNTRG